MRQYKIFHLLLVTAAVSVLCFWNRPFKPTEQGVVSRIEAIGGEVDVLHDPESHEPRYQIRLSGRQFSDKTIDAIPQGIDIDLLNLVGSKISARGVKALLSFRAIRILGLSGTQIDDASLRDIAQIDGLQELLISGTPIDGSGLRYLVKAKQLRTLDVTHCTLNPSALAALDASNSLKVVLVSKGARDFVPARLRPDTVDAGSPSTALK